MDRGERLASDSVDKIDPSPPRQAFRVRFCISIRGSAGAEKAVDGKQGGWVEGGGAVGTARRARGYSLDDVEVQAD